MSAISLSAKGRGASNSAGWPLTSICIPGAGTEDGATGTAPPGCMDEWEMRPVCQT